MNKHETFEFNKIKHYNQSIRSIGLQLGDQVTVRNGARYYIRHITNGEYRGSWNPERTDYWREDGVYISISNSFRNTSSCDIIAINGVPI